MRSIARKGCSHLSCGLYECLDRVKRNGRAININVELQQTFGAAEAGAIATFGYRVGSARRRAGGSDNERGGVPDSGFLQASLLTDGKCLTLDEPGVGSTGGRDSIARQGRNWTLCQTSERLRFWRRWGSGPGRRVEIPARPLAGMEIERRVAPEAHDDFPNFALVSSTYKNVGTADC